MITPILNAKDKKPLYEQIYLFIRTGIEDGRLKIDERLPSKRKLAAHLGVSFLTIENAYGQLSVEGYIRSEQRKGYFVSGGQIKKTAAPPMRPDGSRLPSADSPFRFDLKTNAVNTDDFPYATWTRLMREGMREDPKLLLQPIHPQGEYGLRAEIAAYLRDFRGVSADPEQIVLGAGTEYLLGLICELLSAKEIAVENPGYHKIGKILHGRNVKPADIPMDREGMQTAALRESTAPIALVTPSHHFPLGTVMGIGRRRQLLEWAEDAEDRYIIEDDFDSEFRFAFRPISSLQNLNPMKVIYLNSFAKTLAPSLRIAYMALPYNLLARYQASMLFHSCTVSAFEQHTLKRFLRGGYYERHLNRMRTVYRSRRDAFINGLKALRECVITGQEAGLQLLLRAPSMPEQTLVRKAAESGVGVYPLSGYYRDAPEETHSVVAGYGGFSEAELAEAAGLLAAAWK